MNRNKGIAPPPRHYSDKERAMYYKVQFKRLERKYTAFVILASTLYGMLLLAFFFLLYHALTTSGKETLKSFVLIGGFLDGMRPDPKLTVTQWAEKKRKLSSKGSAEHGPYRVSRTPYLRRAMDALSVSSGIIKIIVMKGIQGGWTEVGFNTIGYYIDCVPCPIMYVMPTVQTMERNVKQRIDPMIDDCPALLEKVGKKRSKDGGNTLHQKDGPGFVLICTGANSAAGLRSVAVRILIMDEVDGYPGDVDGEGSPVALAENRQVTFGDAKKVYMPSTPTIEGESKIESEFDLTAQEYYYVPCPHCEKLQVLEFENMKWEKGKYHDVYMQCIHCPGKIYNRHKTWMLQEKGYSPDGLAEWRVTRPELSDEQVLGQHWSSLYSPDGWLSWTEIAKAWDKAENDEPAIKTFINTILGKSYKVKGDAPAWQQLFERATAAGLSRNVPMNDVAFISAGVDVQADRLEVAIVGWMYGRISQQIDYRVIDGDTAKDDVWATLGEYLNETWTDSSGRNMQIRIMAVDTGWNTSKAYDFCKLHGIKRVIPIKGGKDTVRMPFLSPKAVGKTKQGKTIGKVKVFTLGVGYLKEQLYGWLRLSIPVEGDNAGVIPPGYCHFLPQETHFFRGITAEELVPVRSSKTNAITYAWEKRYARNEPLDTMIYAMAGAYVLGFDRWDAARWKKEAGHTEKTKGKQVPVTATAATETPQPPQKAPESETKPTTKKRRSKGGFW